VRGDGYANGELVVIDPYERIVLTWGWENDALGVPPGSSTVEVTFEAQRGGTLVRLTHAGLPPAALDPHSDGWHHYLDLAVDAEHLLSTLAGHWTVLAPLHRWLVTHVQQP
jgi:uncharacterized protein YndB with AHSA1/START domain